MAFTLGTRAQANLCVECRSSFLPLVLERLVEQKVQVNAAAHEALDSLYENVSLHLRGQHASRRALSHVVVWVSRACSAST